MPYVIDLLREPGVVRVAFTGEVSLQERAEALDAVLRCQAASACRNVLVDLADARLADASASETVAYVSRLAREPAMRAMRIAYVGDAWSASSVESLAALRGYFYQRFRSQAAALRWLCGEAAMLHAA